MRINFFFFFIYSTFYTMNYTSYNARLYCCIILLSLNRTLLYCIIQWVYNKCQIILKILRETDIKIIMSIVFFFFRKQYFHLFTSVENLYDM